MGGANEYSLQNRELNYISKGFLWGLWTLLPIAGPIIMIIKILNRIFRSTSSKVLMFIALIIPYINIVSAIAFFVLVFKRIGGKFLIGVLLLPFLLGIFAAIIIPQYEAYMRRAGEVEASLLIEASYNGETDKVQALLAKGADVNAKDIMGVTALMEAAMQGHTETVKVLLTHGADVSAKTNDGNTALMGAALESHTDIVLALLAKGADVAPRTNTGATPLMGAAIEGHTDIVQVLLAKGANVNAKDNDGNTAMMWAKREGHKEIVRILKEAGAKE